MQFRSELKFDTLSGMPHSAEDMKKAMESNWIHPSFRDGVLTVDRCLTMLMWFLIGIFHQQMHLTS